MEEVEITKRKYIHKLSFEQRSAINKANAAKRKSFGKGVPKVRKNVSKTNKRSPDEYTSMYVMKADREIFARMAASANMSLVELMHRLALVQVANNPRLLEEKSDEQIQS